MNNPLINDGFISIGKIVNAHGVDGTIKVYSYAESLSVFNPGNMILVRNPGDSPDKHYKVKWSAPHSRFVLLMFEEVNSRNLADNLKGSELFIEKAGLPELEENTYYWEDIIGLSVYTEDGIFLGRIESIIETGSNDVYVVNDGKSEVLVPAMESVVLKIDLDKKTMKVNLPEGL
ncbi:MAG: ribosome maturation factor RimM [Desulfobacterales bacterium]